MTVLYYCQHLNGEAEEENDTIRPGQRTTWPRFKPWATGTPVRCANHSDPTFAALERMK
jgi:hypothetical protein